MTELLAFAQQLGGVGFPTLLVAILYGSFRGYWIWGSVHAEMKADLLQRLAKQEQSTEMWQSAALSATGIAELIAKKRNP